MGEIDLSALATTGTLTGAVLLFLLWLRRRISTGTVKIRIEMAKATQLRAEIAAMKTEMAKKDQLIAHLECLRDQYIEHLKNDHD